MKSPPFVSDLDAVLASDTAGEAELARLELRLSLSVEECRRFYPWPALEESFARDLARVRAHLQALRATLARV